MLYDGIISKVGYKRFITNTYTTDSQGRIVSARGTITEVDPSTARNSYAQSNVGKGDGRLPDDDGGHLFGTMFKGSKEIDNLLPQNSNLNRGRWKVMENKWRDAVNNGKKVDVDIKINYGKDGRPTSYDVEYKIDGNDSFKDSFKNESSK